MQELNLAGGKSPLANAKPIVGGVSGSTTIRTSGLYSFDLADEFELEVFGASGPGANMSVGFRAASGGDGGPGGYRINKFKRLGKKAYIDLNLAAGGANAKPADTTKYSVNGTEFTITGGGNGKPGNTQTQTKGARGTAGSPYTTKGQPGGAGGSAFSNDTKLQKGQPGLPAYAVIKWTTPPPEVES